MRAVAEFEHAVKLQPRSFSYWGNLGDALLMQGNRAAAHDAYRRAVEIARAELRIDESRAHVRAIAAGMSPLMFRNDPQFVGLREDQ